jgi:VIT1/CCC1 family predicted Fe2+/Mn2+ transporter
MALLIIMAFTFYISVAKDMPFKRRFIEMAVISLGVSVITFIIGVLVKKYIGVNV